MCLMVLKINCKILLVLHTSLWVHIGLNIIRTFLKGVHEIHPQLLVHMLINPEYEMFFFGDVVQDLKQGLS